MGKILRRGFFAFAFVGFYWSICAAIEFPAPDTSTTLGNNELSVFQPVAWDDPPPGFSIPWVDGNTLVYVPSSEFIMGADEDDNPVHTVSLGSFWIYQSEVTNQMYAMCVAEECDPPMVDPAIPDYTLPELANEPVVGVSWEMAKTYCQWAQGQLPTEAQWELAARGPDGNKFPWGADEPTCDLLNFNNCIGETTAVAAYPEGSSSYGVLDMAGNVSEWVADWYQEDYYGEAPKENPIGPESGQSRSVRGGSYQSGPEQVPSSQRLYLEPDKYRNDLGFRCAVEYTPINKPGLGSPGSSTPDPNKPRSSIAPFCETSFEVIPPKVESLDCPSPSIEIGESYCQGEVGYVNAEVQTCNQMTQLTGDGASFQEYETNKIVSYGSSGASAQLEVCCGCPDIQPPKWTCDDVQCPENYELDLSDCSCVYQAPPVTLMDVQDPPDQPVGGCCLCTCPGSSPLPPQQAKLQMMPVPPSRPIEQEDCMPGFAFDPLGLCCVPEKISIPCQGVYDPNSHTCQLPPPEPTCVTEKFNLPPCTRSSGGGQDGEEAETPIPRPR